MNRKTVIGLLAWALLASQATAQAPAPQKVGSDADKLEAAAAHVARMKAAMKQVLGRVEEARNEKDVVKLNCVNEKLAQIKALLKVAEQSDMALHEALSNKDASADTEFAKIAIARSKIEGLRGESEQCIGQLAYVVDEKTTVEVQLPSDLPGSGAGPGEGLGVATRGANPVDVAMGIGTGDAGSGGFPTRGASDVGAPPPASPYR